MATFDPVALLGTYGLDTVVVGIVSILFGVLAIKFIFKLAKSLTVKS